MELQERIRNLPPSWYANQDIPIRLAAKVVEPWMLNTFFDMRKIRMEPRTPQQSRKRNIRRSASNIWIVHGRLTIRQLQCIGGIAVGMTSNEIGEYLGIGSESVKSSLSAAYRNLNIKAGNKDSPLQAVVMCIRNGWL